MTCLYDNSAERRAKGGWNTQTQMWADESDFSLDTLFEPHARLDRSVAVMIKRPPGLKTTDAVDGGLRVDHVALDLGVSGKHVPPHEVLDENIPLWHDEEDRLRVRVLGYVFLVVVGIGVIAVSGVFVLAWACLQ